MNGELVDLRQESRRLHNMVTQLHQRHHEFSLKVGLMLAWVECSCVCGGGKEGGREVNGELVDLRQESRRLHNMVTQLHQRHHEFTLKVGLVLREVECSCVCVLGEGGGGGEGRAGGPEAGESSPAQHGHPAAPAPS